MGIYDDSINVYKSRITSKEDASSLKGLPSSNQDVTAVKGLLVSPYTSILTELSMIILADYGNLRLKKHTPSDLSYVSQYPFNVPYGIAVDDLYIYMTTAGAAGGGMQKRLRSDYSLVASTAGLYLPRGLDIDDTHIFVTSTYEHKAKKYLKSDLSFVSELTGLSYPMGITVDETHVFFCNYGTNQVFKRLKSDLSAVSVVTITAPLTPVGITEDETYLYLSGEAAFNAILEKRFKSSLALDSFVRGYGSGNDQFAGLIDLAVDNTYIYLTDGGYINGSRIMKRLKSNLTFHSKLEGEGSGDNQFVAPKGIDLGY